MRHVPSPTRHRPRRVAARTLLACAVLVASPALFGCGKSDDGKPSSPGAASAAAHEGDGAAGQGGAEASVSPGQKGGAGAKGGGQGGGEADGRGGGADGHDGGKAGGSADGGSAAAAGYANTSPYVLMTGYDKATNLVSFRKVQGYDDHTGTGEYRFVPDQDDPGTHRLQVSTPLTVHGSKSQTCGQNDDGVDMCSEDGLLNTLASGKQVLAKVHVNAKSVIDTVDEKDGSLTPG